MALGAVAIALHRQRRASTRPGKTPLTVKARATASKANTSAPAWKAGRWKSAASHSQNTSRLVADSRHDRFVHRPRNDGETTAHGNRLGLGHALSLRCLRCWPPVESRCGARRDSGEECVRNSCGLLDSKIHGPRTHHLYSGPGPAFRGTRCRRGRRPAGRPRTILRIPWPQRRGKIHHYQDADRVARAQFRPHRNSRHRPRPRIRSKSSARSASCPKAWRCSDASRAQSF